MIIYKRSLTPDPDHSAIAQTAALTYNYRIHESRFVKPARGLLLAVVLLTGLGKVFGTGWFCWAVVDPA
jgi:hypothetical protein